MADFPERYPDGYTPQPQRSWFARNLLWLIPAGCLLPVLVCGGCIVGIATMVFEGIKSSTPYSEPLARAQADPRVQEALGAPVEARWWVTGEIKVENSEGTANLQIPLQGSRSSGTLHVVGDRQQGQWSYDRMSVETDDGQSIDLLDEESNLDFVPPNQDEADSGDSSREEPEF